MIERSVTVDSFGEGLDEGVFDLLLGDVWGCAVVAGLVLIVAAPDVAAVFAVGMPDFSSEPATTIGALDTVHKRVRGGRAFTRAAG